MGRRRVKGEARGGVGRRRRVKGGGAGGVRQGGGVFSVARFMFFLYNSCPQTRLVIRERNDPPMINLPSSSNRHIYTQQKRVRVR